MADYADYEESTQEIFVSTEEISIQNNSQESDQINNFRINFNQQPFEAEDEDILRINMTQFNLQKNFYDINDSNRFFRISNSAVVAAAVGDMAANAGDEMISIPAGDYKNPDILANCFIKAVENYLNSKLTTGTISSQISAGVVADGYPSDTRNMDLTTDPRENTGRNTGGGQLAPPYWALGALPGGAGSGADYQTVFTRVNKRKYAFQLNIVLAGGLADFRDLNLVIQCLHIPPDIPVTLSSGIVPRPREQYNDFYSLIGGVRVEEFQANPSANFATAIQSFSIESGTGAIAHRSATVTIPFVYQDGLHTLPYIYLRCEEATNQCSKNMESAQQAHDHEVIPSRILAKIPRVENDQHEISYILNNSGGQPYFTNITTNYLNNLTFSITDHKGRRISRIQPSDFPNSVQQQIQAGTAENDLIDMPNNINQVINGNLFCDFAFKVTKHKRKIQRAILQTPQPAIIVNQRLGFSGVIPNSF